MNIVLLTSSLGSGGAERVATTLCNAWVARGDAVTLISTFSGGGQSFYPAAPGVEVIFLADVAGTRSRTIVSYVKRMRALRSLIAGKAPDVVVSFLPNVNVAAIIALARLPIPLIICERSDPAIQPISWFWKSACVLSYRFADMLAVQTSAVADKVKLIFPGLEKVRAVANPVPAEVADTRRRPVAGRKKLLVMGRLAPEKQVDVIIAAFAAGAAQFAEWDLVIYGEGPLRAELATQIAALGMHERVLLKGRTSSPWEIMAEADAFVMASRYEGFPNSLLEAMGVGLPCIALDCPSGPREMSADGQFALLVPLNDPPALADALARVMGDNSFREALGRKARESVLARFSLPEVIGRWDQLFKDVGAIS